MTDFSKYISDHLIKRITLGQSGANVYELDNNRVAKHVVKSELPSAEMWESYKKECLFYREYSADRSPILPKIYHCNISDDEIQLIMEKYRPLDRSDLNGGLLERIMTTLAQVHSLPIPDFLPRREITPFNLSQKDIDEYAQGWRSVLDEHPQAFDMNAVDIIARNINAVNARHFSARRALNHGDFHFDNMLEDENGNIIICDWQSIGCGHVSGDISFLLSRLAGDGYSVNADQAVDLYCKASAERIDRSEIVFQMCLANLKTSFMFWHQYLHDSTEDRVRSIFDKMVADMDSLLKGM